MVFTSHGENSFQRIFKRKSRSSTARIRFAASSPLEVTSLSAQMNGYNQRSAVGQVSMTLSKNDRRWGVLNLLRRLLAAEWETPEQVRDSRATQWGTVPSKSRFSTESWKAALLAGRGDGSHVKTTAN